MQQAASQVTAGAQRHHSHQLRAGDVCNRQERGECIGEGNTCALVAAEHHLHNTTSKAHIDHQHYCDISRHCTLELAHLYAETVHSVSGRLQRK